MHHFCSSTNDDGFILTTFKVVDVGPTGIQTVPISGDGVGTSNPMQALYDISSSFLHQR